MAELKHPIEICVGDILEPLAGAAKIGKVLMRQGLISEDLSKNFFGKVFHPVNGPQSGTSIVRIELYLAKPCGVANTIFEYDLALILI